MATRFRQFVQRVRALTGAGKSSQARSCAAPAEEEEACANLPGLHVPSQSVDAVRDFNTARIDRIEDSTAINNMSARESRRAVVTRPIQF